MSESYYKVLKRRIISRDGEYQRVSILASGNARVVYVPGIPAKAPAWLAEHGYHLTIFSSLADAVRFLLLDITSVSRRAEIWTCDADGVTSDLPPALPYLSIVADFQLAHTRYLRRVGTPSAFTGFPNGTSMATSVVITRRLSIVDIIRAGVNLVMTEDNLHRLLESLWWPGHIPFGMISIKARSTRIRRADNLINLLTEETITHQNL